jgi:hypothetical protein
MDEIITINSVVTAAEAEKLWGLRPSTVKKACLAGRFTAEECRKSGDSGIGKGTWIVTVKGMIRVYGDIILRIGENAERIQVNLQNPKINDRYVSVYRHRGIDICTLKEANPTNGDSLGYVIDHNYYKFIDKDYCTVQSAINDIDANWHTWD